MKHTILVLINLVYLIIFVEKSYCQSSPCPNILQYQRSEDGYYGIVTIPGPGQGRTVINAEIVITGRVFDTKNAGFKLVKPLRDTVDDARRGLDIRYILTFPRSQELPIVQKITLNYNDICVGPTVNRLPKWTYSYQHEFTYPSGITQLSYIPDFSNTVPTIPSTSTPPISISVTPTPGGKTQPDDGFWVRSLPYTRQCGRRPVEEEETLMATQLIIGGTEVIQGEFPWMVALFHLNGRLPVYKCGATLISNNYILTAAHCTKNQRTVYMELGRHNIANTDEKGVIKRFSIDIIPHPEYTSGAHSDVAIVSIERVEFTPKIAPICLWASGTNLDNLIRNGTITGWGRLENDGSFSSVPMKLSVRTVGLDTCRNSNENLRDIATDKTFCAGGKSTGPCHGDSGSGFYIRHNHIWYLRGIISTSLGNDYVCNLNEFAVYVDIAYYLNWLRPYLMS